MEKRVLGKTGMYISALAFGGMSTKGMTQTDADKLFNTALDHGINYIDTAPEYENSEEFIGKAISSRRREYFIATKCGDYLPANGPNKISPNILYTKEVFIQNIENSLKCLKTDYIDLIQLHGVMPEYLPGGQSDELIQLLQDYKQAGKILHIGCTFRNGRSGDELYPAGFGYECMKEFIDWKVFETFQIPYGAMTRKNEIAIQKGYEQGFGMIARGVMKNYQDYYDTLFEKSRLNELFDEKENRNSFLLRFALTHPGLSGVVVGTGNFVHLSDNVNAANRGKLPYEVYTEAKNRLDAVGIGTDEF